MYQGARRLHCWPFRVSHTAVAHNRVRAFCTSEASQPACFRLRKTASLFRFLPVSCSWFVFVPWTSCCQRATTARKCSVLRTDVLCLAGRPKTCLHLST